ncbi:hypothetical protein MACK_002427 [Theileria orientalis]|uniref:Uncharacterized protein n=1 Tax=Theileria orientalis TaxID=68886 RepID=A0A976QV00_THEOR|nr:hypothetical protein MACK_002427 [Theileria orientalis]
MVRLVPPFLRNFIGSSEEPTSSDPPKPDDTDQKSFDYGRYPDLTLQKQLDSDRQVDSGTPNLGTICSSDRGPGDYTTAPSIDSSDYIKDEQLESLEVTSNIATIASIDWGPPKLNPNVLDELGNSGRYLFDMLRGNKLTFENPELLKKNIKNVPKVYESDFNVYLDQMTKIESTDLNMFGDSISESDSSLNVLDNDKVSREYFEDDYNLNDNAIFNSELEVIPNSIELLESQLMVINSQLRELVGTHLKHVGESFVCIQDLKDSYLSVNDQITNVRSVFDNLKGIYHSPVDYHSFKISRSNSRFGKTRITRECSTDSAGNISDATTNNTTSASASGDPVVTQPSSLSGSCNLERASVDSNGSPGKRLFEVKYNEAYTLHEVLLLKRKVIDVMEYLMILRGVVCTPEYIQGLVSNDMALARIFAFCAYEYFRTDLAKFTLTNSVNLVLKDTIVNLEKVAEAKFVDLCYYTLAQCYANDATSNRGVAAGSSCNNQVSNGAGPGNTNRSGVNTSRSDSVGVTSSARFETEMKGTLEKMEPVLIVLTISGILDEIFDTLKSTKMSPVEFKNTIAVEEFKQSLDAVFTGFECSNLFLLHLLEFVKTVYVQNQSRKYLPDSEKARKILETLIFKIQESFPDGINRDYQKIEETTQLLKSELNLPTSFKFQEYNHYWSYYSGDSNLDGAATANSTNLLPLNGDRYADIHNYYEKLSSTVENLFIKSMENLFNNLQLNEHASTDVNDVFNEMESTLATIKGFEDDYRRFVKRSSGCLNVTDRLVSSLLMVDTGTDDGMGVNPVNCSGLGVSTSGGSVTTSRSGSIESRLMKIFYNFVNSQVRKQVGQLFEQSLVEVHENLNKEQWEEFEKVNMENRVYNLILSSVKLSEHLDIYFSISEKFPFLSAATVSKSINLFAYFNTLIENELEKNLSVKKLCLIIETLDYFTILIPLKIRFISSLNASGYGSTSSTPIASERHGFATPTGGIDTGVESATAVSTKDNATSDGIHDRTYSITNMDGSRGNALKDTAESTISDEGALEEVKGGLTATISDPNSSNDHNTYAHGTNAHAINSHFTDSHATGVTTSPVDEGSGGLEAGSMEDYDKLLVLGINAENCVMESKLLRNKSASLLSNFIFSQIKMYLINWVYKYTDIQEGDSVSQEGTEEVDMVIKTIEDLHAECSQFCTVEDLKATFGDSFEKLVDLLKKQNVELSGCNKFSDDCTRIITNLSHLTDIKLEILSLAHGLSS